MKILNISRYLPIKGFPAMNDITLKIYENLRNQYGVESRFIMPLSHIPKWATYFKNSLQSRYAIINNKNYIDKQYNIPVYFFEGFIGFLSKIMNYNTFNDIRLQFPFYRQSLYRQVKSFQPNLVHAHTLEDAFYAYKIYKKFKIPYIITLRGFYHNLYQTDLMKKVFLHAQKLITPSARLQKDLGHLYDVELLPHGLDSIWYEKEDKKKNSKILRLITVASLIEMKNIQTVIKSVAQLINEGYNVQYSIVGEGVYRKALENLVKQEKIESFVTFYGFLDQETIRQVYKTNDVFIMLSYPETFGRVYFEAAAQGLLLIGRKGTGMDGYFTTDEAFVIEANVDEVCAVLKKIDAPLFTSMTSKLKQRIKEFKNDRIIKRYNEILRESC